VSYNIITFVPQCGYFTISNSIFKFNFLAVVVSKISGGPKFTLGGTAPPGHHLAEKIFCTQSKYFTICNCVFNFNLLAPVISEIIGGSQIYIKGPCAPQTPLAEKF